MAFMVLAIFVSLTLTFPYSYSNTRLFSAERQDKFENLRFDENLVFNITEKSRLKCIVRCIQFATCMSVQYSTSTKECVGVNIGYVEDSFKPGHISSSWSYYLVIDDRCPRMGRYVYSNIFNSCYRYHAADLSQHLYDYNPTCESVGAELIKIDSTAKQHHIVKYLSQFNLNVYQWLFIQGKSEFTGDPWRYNDGSLMTYFNWNPSQPESNTDDKYTEHIGMRRKDGFLWHGLWSRYKGSFICEKILFK